MPLPSTGWLSESDNTLQNPESAPLPENDSIRYGDGAESDAYDNEDFSGAIKAEQFGTSGYTFRSGTSGIEYGFAVDVIRTDAYAVILIDNLDPVDIAVTTPDETPETPVETPETPEFVDVDSFDACCCVEDFWTYNGDYFADGSKIAGGLD